ncbi:MAG: hypothetical protein EAZ86_09325 [Oscillatoriales cyanobacterium]|nr:MAG: hypothetical protein EAZ86_09325 [Oscillatoriales cyanobacterium]
MGWGGFLRLFVGDRINGEPAPTNLGIKYDKEYFIIIKNTLNLTMWQGGFRGLLVGWGRVFEIVCW